MHDERTPEYLKGKAFFRVKYKRALFPGELIEKPVIAKDATDACREIRKLHPGEIIFFNYICKLEKENR